MAVFDHWFKASVFSSTRQTYQTSNACRSIKYLASIFIAKHLQGSRNPGWISLHCAIDPAASNESRTFESILPNLPEHAAYSFSRAEAAQPVREGKTHLQLGRRVHHAYLEISVGNSLAMNDQDLSQKANLLVSRTDRMIRNLRFFVLQNLAHHSRLIRRE
jgi:hypothetical protein